MSDARLLDGLLQLLHQHVDDGPLQRCGNVLLVFLNKVGVVLHPLLQRVEERRLQSREAVVKSGNVGLGKVESLRVALTCQTVDDWATGVAQPHHLRALVDGLAGSVVDGLPQHLHVVIGVHLDNLRVTATYQQAKKGQRRDCALYGRLLDEVCHYMPLQVVHVDHRDAQCTGKALGKVHANKQRAHQSGTTREGHSRQLLLLHPSLLQCLVDHRHHILLVGTRCQLGHHAAVGLVHGLRCRHIRQQHPVLEHSSRRVVTARLYT